MPVVRITKVLIEHEQKILILKRWMQAAQRPGEWDLPGGKVEPKELLEDGAVREVLEEVAIGVPRDELAMLYLESSVSQSAPENLNHYAVFGCQADSNEVTLSHEHTEYQWVSISEAAQRIENPVLKRAIAFSDQHNLFALA